MKGEIKMKNIVKNKIQEIADKLIEDNPDEYRLGYVDYGYYNNGVGMASCGGEWEYDEDKAYEDAKEKFAESVENYDSEEYLLQLLENDTFRNTLANMIRRL